MIPLPSIAPSEGRAGELACWVEAEAGGVGRGPRLGGVCGGRFARTWTGWGGTGGVETTLAGLTSGDCHVICPPPFEGGVGCGSGLDDG